MTKYDPLATLEEIDEGRNDGAIRRRVEESTLVS